MTQPNFPEFSLLSEDTEGRKKLPGFYKLTGTGLEKAKTYGPSESYTKEDIAYQYLTASPGLKGINSRGSSTRPPTTEELKDLEERGLLYAPDGRPLYPLTADFKPKLDWFSALMATPAGLVIGGVETAARELRSLQERSGSNVTNPFYGTDYLSFSQAQSRTEGDQEVKEAYLEAIQLKEMEYGRSLNHWEKQDVWDETVYAPPGARGAIELAAELAVPGTLFEKAIGEVLGGTFKGIKFLGGELITKATKVDVNAPSTAGTIAEDAKIIVAPENNFFNIPDVKVGLTRQEELRAGFAETTLGMQYHIDETGTRIVEAVDQVKETTTSLAATISSELDYAIKDVFNINKDGTIHSLNGVGSTPKLSELGIDRPDKIRNLDELELLEDVKIDLSIPEAYPTLSDIAAHFPLYKPHLTDEQISLIMEMDARLRPIKAQLDELKVDEIPTAQNIMEGGVYIPRGAAAIPGKKVETTGATGSSGGSRYGKERMYYSQAESIAQGYKYVTTKDAIAEYIKDSGRDVANIWRAKTLKELKKPDGTPLGSTEVMRLNAHPATSTLRKARNQLRSLKNTVISRNVRLSERSAVAKKAQRKAERAEAQGEREIERTRERTTREGARAIERAETAQQKYEDVFGEYAEHDLKDIRRELSQSINNGRKIADRLRVTLQELRDTKTKLRSGDRKIAKEAEQLRKVMDEAEFMAKALDDDLMLNEVAYETGKSIGYRYDQMAKRAAYLDERWEKMLPKQFELEDRLELLKSQSDLRRGLSQINIEKTKELRQVERAQQTHEALERSLKREWARTEKEMLRQVKLLDNVEARDVKRVQKEIKKAQGEAAATDERAVRALVHLAQTQEAILKTKAIYDEAMAKWNHAKKFAGKEPDGYGPIDARTMPSLTGYSFPAKLARAINKQVADELPTTGKQASTLNFINWYSALYRSLRATLDDSAPMIQILLRAYDNPVLAAKAIGWHVKAWGPNGEELLGSYMRDFNQKALSEGRMTTDDMGRYGLHVGGVDTEFTVGNQKYLDRLGKTPGIKQANRAFGFVGDRVRVEWMDNGIKDLMKGGRTLQDIIDSGDARELALAVNAATGYSGKKFGGSLGEMLMFAPKFFQARLETLTRFGQAMVRDPLGSVEAVPLVGTSMRRNLAQDGLARDIPMRQRETRRAMLRMIGGGVSLTVLANEMQGQETDFRPMVKDKKGDWHYNSNFMRIRFKGRDYSLFGTWDSLARLLVLTGMGKPHEGVLGLASGPVATASNLIFDENTIGEPTRTELPTTVTDRLPFDGALEKLAFLIESHLPFSYEMVPEMIEPVMEEGSTVIEKALGGAGAFARGFTGVNSSPLTYHDTIKEIAKENRGDYSASIEEIAGIPWAEEGEDAIPPLGKMLAERIGISDPIPAKKSPTAFKDNPGWDADNLSRAEEDIIKQDPRMQKLIEGFDAEDKEGLGKAYDDLKGQLLKYENELLIHIDAGMQGQKLVDAIRDFKTARSTLYGAFQDINAAELAQLDENDQQTHIFDLFAQRYWEVQLTEDKDSGYRDYPAQEEKRAEILEEARKFNPDLPAYITGTGEGTFRGVRFEDPKVRALIEEYDQDIQVMVEYYNAPMFAAQKFGLEKEYKHYLNSPRSLSDYLKLGKYKEDLKVIQIGAMVRKNMLRGNKEDDPWLLEAKLYKWGIINRPTNPVVLAMVTNLQLAELVSEDGIFNRNDMETEIQKKLAGQ